MEEFDRDATDNNDGSDRIFDESDAGEIDLGADLANSEQLRVGESDTGGDNRRNRKSGARGKLRQRIRSEKAQEEEVVLTKEQNDTINSSLDMIFMMANTLAVNFAGSEEAQIAFMEELMMRQGLTKIMSRVETLEMVNRQAPYAMLIIAMMLWSKRVFDVRRRVQQEKVASMPGFEQTSFTEEITPFDDVPTQEENPDTSFIHNLMESMKIA